MADILRIVWKQETIGEGWDASLDPVIWIATAALDAEWGKSSDYISAGGIGSLHAGRYEHFGKFFPAAEFIYMPTISFDEQGIIVFTNGRHRFAWLRDHGVRSLPIQVEEEQADLFESRFGTRDRVGVIM